DGTLCCGSLSAVDRGNRGGTAYEHPESHSARRARAVFAGRSCPMASGQPPDTALSPAGGDSAPPSEGTLAIAILRTRRRQSPPRPSSGQGGVWLLARLAKTQAAVDEEARAAA